MTTIVNNPPPSNDSGGMAGLIIGLILVLVIVYVVIMYGIPAVQNMQLGSPQINIPSEIDVNINQTTE